MDESFIENLLPALNVDERLSSRVRAINEDKVYKDNDVGENKYLDSEAVREAFRNYDEAFRYFYKMNVLAYCTRSEGCYIVLVYNFVGKMAFLLPQNSNSLLILSVSLL